MFSLRLAKADDIEIIRKLIDASVRGLSTAFYTPAQIESALVHIFGLYTALGFQPLERYSLPTPDGVGLPVVRMTRGITTFAELSR